jgi:hypothetical protein
MPMSGVNHMATLMLAQLPDVLDSFAGRDAAEGDRGLDAGSRD